MLSHPTDASMLLLLISDLLSLSFLSRAIDTSVNNSDIYRMVFFVTSYLFVDLCGFAERMSQKYECVIGDPQMLSHDSQTVFSVSQMFFWFFFHKHNFQFYKWLFVLQMENDIFTNTHIFVKTNTQVTNRKFVFVHSKTRVQLKPYL